MLDVFPQAAELNSTTDFFEDLGGHSLTAATLVSKLRRECPEGSPLKSIGLYDIYTH